METVVADIANSNAAVGAGLRRTMRNPSPMWSINPLADELAVIREAEGSLAQADTPTARLEQILEETLASLLETLRGHFRANQLEGPVLRLLQQLFPPPAQVLDRRGPKEHGADFIVTNNDAFGREHVTVIQLKDHPKVLDDTEALEQIRDAANTYSPTAAVILTTAAREASGFSQRREELEEELGIPITTVLGRQLAAWFLGNLEALAAD